jgi:hypothetical protein
MVGLVLLHVSNSPVSRRTYWPLGQYRPVETKFKVSGENEKTHMPKGAVMFAHRNSDREAARTAPVASDPQVSQLCAQPVVRAWLCL